MSTAGRGRPPGVVRQHADAVEVDGVYTNKPPGGRVAYRCSFRVTEAIHAIERMVDILAHDIGKDPAQLRMENFIQPEQFHCRSPERLVVDPCPRQDSNLRFRLRRAALYPLSYGGRMVVVRGRTRWHTGLLVPGEASSLGCPSWNREAARRRSRTESGTGWVLVCDDTASIRLLMRINLELAGFEVLEAGTARRPSTCSTGTRTGCRPSSSSTRR